MGKMDVSVKSPRKMVIQNISLGCFFSSLKGAKVKFLI